MAIGPRDTSTLVTLTGWDADELNEFRLQDGTGFGEIVSGMNAALGALNAEITNDPLWSSLVSYQDVPEVEYRVGVSNGFGDFTEYGRADSKRADTEGHMLPLLAKDRMLGWTWKYLQEARISQIDADIADAIKDAKDLYRVQYLTRLLKRGDDTGLEGLGSTGISTGFATAAASTGVDYTPPAHNGNTFTSDHEHYIGIAGGAFTDAVFTDSKDELREHGHEPPYEFIIGTSDESTVRGLTNFVEVANFGVSLGNDTAVSTLGVEAQMNGSYYIGAIHDFMVRVMPGMPQYYGFGWKSYGANSQRNPLRIRLKKGTTTPLVRAFSDPRSGAGAAYPLQELMLYTQLGVGVANRTNGTARYVNNATWADGTPT